VIHDEGKSLGLAPGCRDLHVGLRDDLFLGRTGAARHLSRCVVHQRRSASSPLQLGADIKNISGATLSSKHITDGVKRVLQNLKAGG
jgi:hypothetical protein